MMDKYPILCDHALCLHMDYKRVSKTRELSPVDLYIITCENQELRGISRAILLITIQYQTPLVFNPKIKTTTE